MSQAPDLPPKLLKWDLWVSDDRTDLVIIQLATSGAQMRALMPRSELMNIAKECERLAGPAPARQ